MVIAAIVACEIGFWVVLAAGLIARYGLRRPRLSTALLLAVPVVDLALLVFTAVDLRRGAEPTAAHSLAAIYLGFTVAFGHDIIRWADARVAARFAGGPPPRRSAPGGTAARMREEWRAFGLAALGAALAAAAMLLLAGLSASDDRWALLGALPVVGTVLMVWLIGWPVTETVRVLLRRRPAAL
jgi:hypothetical protein